MFHFVTFAGNAVWTNHSPGHLAQQINISWSNSCKGVKGSPFSILLLYQTKTSLQVVTCIKPCVMCRQMTEVSLVEVRNDTSMFCASLIMPYVVNGHLTSD